MTDILTYPHDPTLPQKGVHIQVRVYFRVDLYLGYDSSGAYTRVSHPLTGRDFNLYCLHPAIDFPFPRLAPSLTCHTLYSTSLVIIYIFCLSSRHSSDEHQPGYP